MFVMAKLTSCFLSTYQSKKNMYINWGISYLMITNWFLSFSRLFPQGLVCYLIYIFFVYNLIIMSHHYKTQFIKMIIAFLL